MVIVLAIVGAVALVTILAVVVDVLVECFDTGEWPSVSEDEV